MLMGMHSQAKLLVGISAWALQLSRSDNDGQCEGLYA